MNQLAAAQANLDALRTEAETMLNRSEPLDTEEATRFGALEDEIKTAGERVALLTRTAQALAGAGGTLESGSGLEGDNGVTVRTPELRRQMEDPWAAAREALPGQPVTRDAAMTALERSHAPDDSKARIESIVRSDAATEEREFVLRSSDPNYQSAYMTWMRNSEVKAELSYTDLERQAVRDAEPLVRAFNEANNVSGGFLVPFHLDPSIMLTSNGYQDPMRQLADVVQLIGTNVWHGISSDGFSAEYVGEGVEMSAVTATFSQPTIVTYKAEVYAEVTFEQLADSTLEQQLPMLVADAKAKWESNEFTNGTGSTCIQGLVAGLAGTTASRLVSQTASALGVPDVFNMVNAIPDRFADNASWLASKTNYNRIRQQSTDATFWAPLGAGRPAELLGFPAYSNSAMTASATSSTSRLVLGDIRQAYKIVDRLGMTAVRSDWVTGSNRRPTGTTGFVWYWRVGGGVVNANAARLVY